MSKWTGKSDFADWCEMHNTPKEIVKNAIIYYGNVKVSLEKSKDLIPYYTHLTSTIVASDGKQLVELSAESYLDYIEKEFIASRVYSCILWARRAIRTKSNFNYSFCKAQKEYTNGDEAVWKAIIKIIKDNPEIIKFHLNKNNYKARAFIIDYIIPHYFSKVHDSRRTMQREQFVKYCSENGYCAFSIDFENNIWGYQTQGEWHPVIRDMCWKIADYHKMIKEFNNDKKRS